jgi:hypothetical protein
LFIVLGSYEHKCYHEAGHIEIAVLEGARVISSTVPNNGVAFTRVIHPNWSTKKPIACGGFAMEQILFEKNWLFGADRMALSPEEFQRQAIEYAHLDKASFFELPPNIPGPVFEPDSNDAWSAEADALFVKYARERVRPALLNRISVIQSLAAGLSYGIPLDEEEIIDRRRFA